MTNKKNKEIKDLFSKGNIAVDITKKGIWSFGCGSLEALGVRLTLGVYGRILCEIRLMPSGKWCVVNSVFDFGGLCDDSLKNLIDKVNNELIKGEKTNVLQFK